MNLIKQLFVSVELYCYMIEYVNKEQTYFKTCWSCIIVFVTVCFWFTLGYPPVKCLIGFENLNQGLFHFLCHIGLISFAGTSEGIRPGVYGTSARDSIPLYDRKHQLTFPSVHLGAKCTTNPRPLARKISLLFLLFLEQKEWYFK